MFALQRDQLASSEEWAFDGREQHVSINGMEMKADNTSEILRLVNVLIVSIYNLSPSSVVDKKDKTSVLRLDFQPHALVF